MRTASASADAEPVAGRMIEDLRRGALQPFYLAESASLDGLPAPAPATWCSGATISASTPFRPRGGAIEAAPSAQWRRFIALASAPARWMR